MLRVQANESIGRGNSRFGVVVFKVGVNQLQLRLLGVLTEGKVFLQKLQGTDGRLPLATTQLPLGGVVEQFFGVFWRSPRVFAAKPGASG